jgi:predicted metalloprotease
MGRRRRDFDEFEDETREPAPSGSSGGWIVAATFIKYAAIVIVVLIVAYVVLRILGVLQTSV